MSIEKKVIFITGGSSGLGEAIARHAAAEGAKVFLTARRKDRLVSIVADIEKAGGKAAFKTADVTDAVQVKAAADAATEAFGAIDVLVNNAGLMPLSPMGKLKTDEWETMVDVNIKGVLNAIAATLPDMQARESGHIINMSSVAGHKVFPGAAVYCGTKFAVRAISEGLRAENAGKLRVTNVSPGAVNTELTSTISDPDAKDMANNLYEIAIDADAIARAVVFAIKEPDDVSVNELIIRPTKQEL